MKYKNKRLLTYCIYIHSLLLYIFSNMLFSPHLYLSPIFNMWVIRNRKPGAECVCVVGSLSALEGATHGHPVREDSRHSTGWKGDHEECSCQSEVYPGRVREGALTLANSNSSKGQAVLAPLFSCSQFLKWLQILRGRE